MKKEDIKSELCETDLQQVSGGTVHEENKAVIKGTTAPIDTITDTIEYESKTY